MLARFLSNTRGGVAPLMAVVAVPLLVGVGMAVDYTRANAARAAFQVSLDATALMLSKNAANEDSTALQTQATNTFNALYKHPEVNNITVTPTYTADAGSKLTLKAPLPSIPIFSASSASARSASARRRFRPGATHACALRLCSTIPVRCRAPARWPLSRPHLTIC